MADLIGNQTDALPYEALLQLSRVTPPLTQASLKRHEKNCKLRGKSKDS